jgi:hypothetical protein
LPRRSRGTHNAESPGAGEALRIRCPVVADGLARGGSRPSPLRVLDL